MAESIGVEFVEWVSSKDKKDKTVHKFILTANGKVVMAYNPTKQDYEILTQLCKGFIKIGDTVIPVETTVWIFLDDHRKCHKD